jgi:hypothetical protein
MERIEILGMALERTQLGDRLPLCGCNDCADRSWTAAWSFPAAFDPVLWDDAAYMEMDLLLVDPA